MAIAQQVKAASPSAAKICKVEFPKGQSVIKPNEFADLLGLCQTQVGELIEDGSIQAINVAGANSSRKSWRIPREAFEDFIKRRHNHYVAAT